MGFEKSMGSGLRQCPRSLRPPAEGKLKRWHIEGDRRRFVDLDEVHKLLEPRPIAPKLKP